MIVIDLPYWNDCELALAYSTQIPSQIAELPSRLGNQATQVAPIFRSYDLHCSFNRPPSKELSI